MKPDSFQNLIEFLRMMFAEKSPSEYMESLNSDLETLVQHASQLRIFLGRVVKSDGTWELRYEGGYVCIFCKGEKLGSKIYYGIEDYPYPHDDDCFILQAKKLLYDD